MLEEGMEGDHSSTALFPCELSCPLSGLQKTPGDLWITLNPGLGLA